MASGAIRASEPGTPATTRAVFVLEQTLGHVTHSANLESLVPSATQLDPTFLRVPFETRLRSLPIWSNWTVRAGIRTMIGLLRLLRSDGPPPDVMFVHTQVPAVLLGPWMRRWPTVVSIDATPRQYDEFGEFYAHDRDAPWLERIKTRANVRCFRRAAHVVAWSEWAKQGLVDHYDVSPENVSVIAPGVDLAHWTACDRSVEPHRTVRILFVGGDLHRKGGDLLVEAVRRLRADPDVPDVELDLVTGADVADDAGINVHRGLTSNAPELIALYHAADIFCLPTLGDCLPMVLAEAAAAQLPLVSTDVGAISEIVKPGLTGALVPTGDVHALVSALATLIADPDLRQRLGRAASSP